VRCIERLEPKFCGTHGGESVAALSKEYRFFFQIIFKVWKIMISNQCGEGFMFIFEIANGLAKDESGGFRVKK